MCCQESDSPGYCEGDFDFSSCGSCPAGYLDSGELEQLGCTDDTACNFDGYDDEGWDEDNSCDYPTPQVCYEDLNGDGIFEYPVSLNFCGSDQGYGDTCENQGTPGQYSSTQPFLTTLQLFYTNTFLDDWLHENYTSNQLESGLSDLLNTSTVVDPF